MTAAVSERTAIGGILAVSAAALSFLVWLIYFKSPPEEYSEIYNRLPAVNAMLNGLSACALAAGFVAIKRRSIKAHMTLMITAFVFSALFLVSYIVYHNVHGDTPFQGQGPVRSVYFFILISHIVLSIVALPMILTTFFFSLTKRFEKHKKLARWTFPIWLYVSVTGVAVFFLLRNFGME